MVGTTRLGSTRRERRTNQTPSGNALDQFGGHLDGQAGLADAPRPGQRHQPHVVALEQRDQRRQLPAAAQQGRRLDGQVVLVACPAS